jgi:beta-glucosidase
VTDTDHRFPFQDPTLADGQRIEDLLSRMSVADKAGVMFHPLATVGPLESPGPFGLPSTAQLLAKRINHVNILDVPTARGLAEWVNTVQAQAAAQPLGIPVTVSSDPRHSLGHNPLADLLAGPFTEWPEPLGLAAIGDTGLVGEWADTVRREYVACGIRTSLGPQLDLATEPRWCRQSGTFGQDPATAGRLGAAYVKGLQGVFLGPESVSAMAKHFPGGGPQADGEDPHFEYGCAQVYPGGQFEAHLRPFRDAIAAGVTQLMPYYGVPTGMPGVPEVGFAFNQAMIGGLLRDQLGFTGVICSDWGVLSMTPWGVQHLTYDQRMAMALDAGVDQFGGESTPEVLVGLVQAGRVPESRLDASVRRLLAVKFELGLFDDPFVDPDRAAQVVGTAPSREAGMAAQAAAHTLLLNAGGAHHLPLPQGIKVYVEGMDAAALAGRADVVATPAEANVAILRLFAPWEQRGAPASMESFMHAGTLQFPTDQIEHVRAVTEAVPTVVDVYLERPAILTELSGLGVSLIANFGAGDEAFARVLFGEAEPRGSLPFQLPSSMEAVTRSRPDVAGDTANPAFQFGHGLRYEHWQPSPAPCDDDRARTTAPQVAGAQHSAAPTP